MKKCFTSQQKKSNMNYTVSTDSEILEKSRTEIGDFEEKRLEGF